MEDRRSPLSHPIGEINDSQQYWQTIKQVNEVFLLLNQVSYKPLFARLPKPVILCYKSRLFVLWSRTTGICKQANKEVRQPARSFTSRVHSRSDFCCFPVFFLPGLCFFPRRRSHGARGSPNGCNDRKGLVPKGAGSPPATGQYYEGRYGHRGTGER